MNLLLRWLIGAILADTVPGNYSPPKEEMSGKRLVFCDKARYFEGLTNQRLRPGLSS